MAELRNKCGYTRDDYKGSPSTLCPGCGHDAITNHVISAMFQGDIDPFRLIKVSGIGCSSKTPAYFGKMSFAFNTVHGRMPSIATGAKIANGSLHVLGVSGDGDTASIGLGQFCHLVRRNLDMVYVVENNGVYGLTKGQFSATADLGSKLKTGVVNDFEPIDICRIAIELGCPYVARSFSGDGKQLVPLLKGGFSFRGTSVLDVISPCVTFNNHEGSTKSYAYVKEHDIALHDIGFIPHYDEIKVDYKEGEIVHIELHDGSRLSLKKTGRDYDPTDRMAALRAIEDAEKEGVILTGLLYYRGDKKAFNDILNLSGTPLAALDQKAIRPSRQALDEIMKDFGCDSARVSE